MYILDNSLYLDDLDYIANLDLPWEKLQNKCILISGATGLIGSFFVDSIMKKNESGLNCLIYALNRNNQKAIERFAKWSDNPLLQITAYDIKKPLDSESFGKVDYVLHMASNTHPLLYSSDPIGTITTNIIGAQNMLDFSVNHKIERFAFVSSNEIYGENRGDNEMFDEYYCGYINCNTLRAGYPESKRCGEALCQAYKHQKNLDVVIPRVTRTYGPTMLLNDSKAVSQFIKNGINGEDIVLKSSGTQYYSYTHVVDAVSGILFVLLKGTNGEAYNIADEKSDVMLKDLAETVANISNTKVVFDIPEAVEAAGFSVVTKARLDGRKLKNLGWNSKYDIQSGMLNTMSILKSLVDI